jgi:hypothetical protein
MNKNYNKFFETFVKDVLVNRLYGYGIASPNDDLYMLICTESLWDYYLRMVDEGYIKNLAIIEGDHQVTDIKLLDPKTLCDPHFTVIFDVTQKAKDYADFLKL